MPKIKSKRLGRIKAGTTSVRDHVQRGRCHACLCRRAMLQIWKPTAAQFQPARISARRAARARHPPRLRLLQLQLVGERETSDIIDRQTRTTASAPALRQMIICAPRRPRRCEAISSRCGTHYGLIESGRRRRQLSEEGRHADHCLSWCVRLNSKVLVFFAEQHLTTIARAQQSPFLAPHGNQRRAAKTGIDAIGCMQKFNFGTFVS